MATTYKVLAQTGSSGSTGNGSATLTAVTNTNLYTVPAATQSVVSTMVICNQTALPQTVNVAVRPAGAAIAAQHYVAYNLTVGASDTTALTMGFTLGATDIVTVYASSASMSFHLYGSEIA